MIELEFISLGDLHLEGLDTLFSETGDDKIYESLEQVVAYAQENGITSIIQTGDICNSASPEQETITRLIKFCLKHRDINWYFILGNHDIKSDIKHSSLVLKFVYEYGLAPNVFFFDSEQLHYINKVPFVFCPYPLVKSSPTAFPTVNIAHVETLGAKYDNGREITKGVKLKTNQDVYIIGHLHQYQNLDRVIYPGMVYQKTFGDSPNKGFIHCVAKWSKKSLKLQHKFIPITPTHTLVNLVIHTLEDLTTVEKSPNILYKPFIKSDLVLPDSFLREHPNVLTATGFKNKQELVALQEGSYSLEDVQVLDSAKVVVKNLDQFLKARGLTAQQVKQGLSITSEIIEAIRISKQ